MERRHRWGAKDEATRLNSLGLTGPTYSVLFRLIASSKANSRFWASGGLGSIPHLKTWVCWVNPLPNLHGTYHGNRCELVPDSLPGFMYLSRFLKDRKSKETSSTDGLDFAQIFGIQRFKSIGQAGEITCCMIRLKRL